MPPLKASAENGYRRIITEDTPFYSDLNGENLSFYLPYSYYVKVIKPVGEYTHIECYGTGGTITLDGYVPTEMLFDDGLEVVNPYPQVSVLTATDTVLYKDNTLITPIQYLFKDRELFYYGQSISNDGQKIYCVGYNNRIGFVSEKDLIPFYVPLHPNDLTFLSTPNEQPPIDDQTPTEPNKISLDGLRIAVIICLISAGLIALLLSFKRKPTPQNTVGYYDENDYG